MKTILTTLASALVLSAAAQDIQLPSPDMAQPSMSVVQALNTRHSTRAFSSQSLNSQELSNLCWAACGVSRDADHRTSPTARNLKEIRLMVFTKEGVYEYQPVANCLQHLVSGDHRSLVAGNRQFKQDFVVEAPVSLVMVIDFARFGSHDERALMMGCVDAGNVSENINLYCQSVGLCTVPRATMDTDGIRKLLSLTEEQLPVMNNPVGYSK